jgi:hypothetical protein
MLHGTLAARDGEQGKAVSLVARRQELYLAQALSGILHGKSVTRCMEPQRALSLSLRRSREVQRTACRKTLSLQAYSSYDYIKDVWG